MREPFLYVVVGQKGVGKTTASVETLRQYVKGNGATGAHGRKVLIFDTQNEYANPEKYPDVTAISYDRVALFTVHPTVCIKRVPPFKKTGVEMTPDQKAMCVIYILSRYRNGLLLLEDINSYIGDHLKEDVVGTILSQRHKGIDMVLHYHSFGRIQKKVWPHINFIRMHKCGDSVENNKEKFPEKVECFKIAELIVNNQFFGNNKWFYLHIDCIMQKILADISIEERDKAIEQYIMQNNRRLISPYLDMRDRTGGKRYTYATAFDEEQKRILTAYF